MAIQRNTGLPPTPPPRSRETERSSTTTPPVPPIRTGTTSTPTTVSPPTDRFDSGGGTRERVALSVPPPSVTSGSTPSLGRADLPPPILAGLRPVEVATTTSLISIDGYGAGAGNRLIPLPSSAGRSVSSSQARQAVLSAYGLANPTSVQQQAINELNLFGGSDRVSAWVMPSGTFLPVNISPELDSHLRQIGGLRRHADNAQESARSAIEQGSYYPDRTALWQQLVGSGVSQDVARGLLERNDQNVSTFLARVSSDVLDPNGTAYYNNLSQTLPPLVSSGYLTQQQAQRLMDRNLLRSYQGRLEGDRANWPTPREINDAGFSIIQRGNATPQEVEALKQRARGETPAQTLPSTPPPQAPVAPPSLPPVLDTSRVVDSGLTLQPDGTLGTAQPSQAVTAEERSGLEQALDNASGVLDLLGLVPVIGEAADAANIAVNLARGRPLEAALSAISLIPIVGDAVGKTAKAALRAADPALARRALDALRQVDVGAVVDNLARNPALRGLGEQLGRAVDDVIAQLDELVNGRQLQPALPDGGSLPDVSRPLEARTNRPGSGGRTGSTGGSSGSSGSTPMTRTTPRAADGSAAPRLSDRFQASARYTRSSDLAVLVPNSNAWRQAVQALRNGGPEAINNVRVASASDARRLLDEAFPPGSPRALEHSRTYTNGSPRSYQFHPPDAQDVNDLSHIKWQTPEGEGHIFFGNPGNSGASRHYITQRDYDQLLETFTPEELDAFGIQPGGNRIGPDGRDRVDSYFLRPENRPGR